MQNKDNLNCEMYRSLLFDYVSDNLSKQESDELLLHIKSCPECMRELEEIESILSAAAEMPELEVPSTLKAAVSIQLAEVENEIKLRKKRIYRYAVGTFMPIAACAVLAIGIFSGGFYDKVINTDNIISMEPPYNTETADKEPTIKDVAKQTEEQNTDINEAQTIQATEERAAESGTDTKDKKALTNEAKKPKAEPDVEIETVAETVAEAKAEASADVMALAEDTQAEAISSGGGEAGNSAEKPPEKARMLPETDALAGGGNEESEIMMARMYDDTDTELKDLNIPQSCTIVTEDPADFVSGFGIVTDEAFDDDKIEFELSADRWREFIDYNRQCGTELNAEYNDSQNDFIAVTVIKTNEE